MEKNTLLKPLTLTSHVTPTTKSYLHKIKVELLFYTGTYFIVNCSLLFMNESVYPRTFQHHKQNHLCELIDAFIPL